MWKALHWMAAMFFSDEPRAAVDQAGDVSAVEPGLARDLVVVALVGLTKVGGVGAGDGPLGTHPVHGGAGVQAAREGDADTLAGRKD